MSRPASVLPALATVLLFALAPWADAQPGNPASDPGAAQTPAGQQAAGSEAKMAALAWVKGPTTVPVAGNSTLTLPDGYVFLDAANTAKFEELTHNLGGGTEVLLAPRSMDWVAYLEFSAEGLVKDDEKIDADAILSSLKSATEQANDERRRRGWDTLRITGWALPPAYNRTTKRLEWAPSFTSSTDAEGVNFFTKILGRRGVTSVVLVAPPGDLDAAVGQLNQVLGGYAFNDGERYADWVPGDKVAEYGLAGLIVGGGVALAAKTGLLKGLLAAVLAGWKIIAAGAVAAFGGLRALLSRKKTGPS